MLKEHIFLALDPELMLAGPNLGNGCRRFANLLTLLKKVESETQSQAYFVLCHRSLLRENAKKEVFAVVPESEGFRYELISKKGTVKEIGTNHAVFQIREGIVQQKTEIFRLHTSPIECGIDVALRRPTQAGTSFDYYVSNPLTYFFERGGRREGDVFSVRPKDSADKDLSQLLGRGLYSSTGLLGSVVAYEKDVIYAQPLADILAETSAESFVQLDQHDLSSWQPPFTIGEKISLPGDQALFDLLVKKIVEDDREIVFNAYTEALNGPQRLYIDEAKKRVSKRKTKKISHSLIIEYQNEKDIAA